MNGVIPSLINHANIYDEGEKLIGLSGDIELPEFSAITDTTEGAGVIGSFDAPATGHFEDMTIKIPFAVLYADLFKIVNTTQPPLLTLRASVQSVDPATGATDYYPLKVVLRGPAKTYKLGSVTKGKKMEAEVELSIQYIRIELDEEPMVELDKLNFVYRLNGVDLMEKIRSQV